MPALNGWHPGERAVHRKLDYTDDPAVSQLYMYIDGDMPHEHRVFHTTRLPFVPVTTLDVIGRPWGSILAGRDGKPGFIKSPSDTSLVLDAKVWEGEPLIENAKLFGRKNQILVAGIGIEFPTRRRNKFAGHMSKLSRREDGSFQLEFIVNQAIGNCPKYINARDLIPYPTTSPKLFYQKLQLSPTDRLPEAAISFIHDSDTVFLGTSYVAILEDERRFPSHLGMNQRGGRRGFVRVAPSDGRTVVLPDFSGNRFMTSLGNIEATPLASLTFISFTTGDILYLTGTAKTLFGPAAQHIMPLQNTLTTVHVTGYTLVQDALPVRQRPNTTAQPSPYSPPIRFLAKEAPATYFDKDAQVSALLTRIDILSPSLATFTWESSKELQIKPGQAAVLDFTSVIGAAEYQHMAPVKPTSVNDDRIRTWTVSTSSPPTGTRTFPLTMRAKHGGTVTGALFAIARKLAEAKPELLSNTRPLELTVRIMGISGDFVLPEPEQSIGDDELGITVPQKALTSKIPKKLLWIAGGIGVTPFLSMLSSVTSSLDDNDWDIALVLSTREPDILLPLISSAIASKSARRPVHLSLDVFSDEQIPDLDVDVVLRRHAGRVSRTFFAGATSVIDLESREVYVCGPELFEKAVVAALADANIEPKDVRREGFGY